MARLYGVRTGEAGSTGYTNPSNRYWVIVGCNIPSPSSTEVINVKNNAGMLIDEITLNTAVGQSGLNRSVLVPPQGKVTSSAGTLNIQFIACDTIDEVVGLL